MMKLLSEIMPSVILLEEFIKPMSIKVPNFALSIDVAPSQMSKIKHGMHSISTETALSLVVFFSMEARLYYEPSIRVRHAYNPA